MPNLLDETSGLIAFVRTVEAGSFTAAARILGTSPSAISKSISRLEKRVGSRLFLRTTRAVTLTQDGLVLFERVAPLLRQLDEGDNSIVAPGALSGRLRVSMSGELASLLLPRLFGNFADIHPGLQLDIGFTDRLVDLVREDYDVALRIGFPVQQDIVVRRLAELPMAIVSSPAFAESRLAPASTADLAALPFVRYTMGGVVQPILIGDGSTFIPTGRVSCDTGAGLIYAARCGLGAAYLLRCLVRDELEAGTLVELSSAVELPKLPLNVLHAFGRTVPHRVRLFCDFMAGEAKAIASL